MTGPDPSLDAPCKHFQPAVRVEASYAATDGRTPETINIVWERGSHTLTPDLITRLVYALAVVPLARELAR